MSVKVISIMPIENVRNDYGYYIVRSEINGKQEVDKIKIVCGIPKKSVELADKYSDITWLEMRAAVVNKYNGNLWQIKGIL